MTAGPLVERWRFERIPPRPITCHCGWITKSLFAFDPALRLACFTCGAQLVPFRIDAEGHALPPPVHQGPTV